MLENKSDLPSLAVQDYKYAYAKFEGYCRASGAVRFVGKFGEVNDPPVSDLDVIVGLQDHRAKEVIQTIADFIAGDPVLDHVFAHPPLYVIESIEPYVHQLHTLNGLLLTYNPVGFSAPKNDPDYIELLGAVWASYVIVVAGDLIKRPEAFNPRYALMVLKNIQQSVLNSGGRADSIVKGSLLRRKFIERALSYEEIINELKNSLTALFKQVDENDKYLEFKCLKYNYKLSLNDNLSKAADSSLTIREDSLEIKLSQSLFFIFDYLYNDQFYENLQSLNAYKKALSSSFAICRSLKIKCPFITPFNFDFFPANTKNVVRKKILSFLG